jgi:membrane protein DedA with SNARE-associated domain
MHSLISLSQTIGWIFGYGYPALFILAVIEGPIVTVIAGFFASLGYLNFFIAYPVIVAGDLGGDVIYYLIGRFGGIRFINKWGKYIGLGPDEILALEKHFEKHGRRLLFIGKMSHGIGGAFLVAAGLVKMPFGEFFSSNFLATLAKSLILLLIGFFFGHALVGVNSVLEKISVVLIGAGFFFFLIYFLYFRKKRRNLQ